MSYIALKEMTYHGRRYRAGEALPASVVRWTELRFCQRRGFISTREEPAAGRVSAAALTPSRPPKRSRKE